MVAEPSYSKPSSMPTPFYLTALVALATFLGGCTTMPEREFQTIDDYFDLYTRPVVIAHRGFSGIAPENTLVAVRKAIEADADMVELDFSLTKDGEVVCIHDDTLERTTDGAGLVADATWEEIQQLDAGSWFSEEYAGEPVPHLNDVLDLVQGKMLINIEIKPEAYHPEPVGSISHKVLDAINKRDMRDQVVISSFDGRILKQIREIDSTIKTATLYNEETDPVLNPLAIVASHGSNGFNLGKTQVKAWIVKDCHRRGIPVSVYTVNTKPMIRMILDMGVDAIFTNYPDRMFEVLDEIERRVPTPGSTVSEEEAIDARTDQPALPEASELGDEAQPEESAE